MPRRLLAFALCALSSLGASSDIDPATAPRLHLKWKLHLASQPRELTNLATPQIASNSSLAIIAGASGTLDAVDTTNGRLLWHRQFPETASPQNPTWLCPNALNAAPALDGEKAYVLTADGRLHSVNLRDGNESSPAIPFVPPFAKSWTLRLDHGVVYTTTSQGCGGAQSGVYSLDLSDHDLSDHAVHFFAAAPAGAGIWGSTGVAIANQRIFAITGDGAFDPARKSYANSVVALTPRTLQLQDYFTPANWERLDRLDLDMGSISPLAFPFEGRELLAAAGKEGRIFLLDANSLGGSRHQTPLSATEVLVNTEHSSAGRGFWGAFGTWETSGHVRYLFAPAWGAPSAAAKEAPHGAILAFRVEDHAGTPTLAPAWTSRDLNVPSAPVIANGVVFALSSGEQSAQFDRAGRQYNTADRIRTAPGAAILYAFDAATGRELFSSGKTMRSFSHRSGLAVSGGQIYVVTFDSMLYCFGL